MRSSTLSKRQLTSAALFPQRGKLLRARAHQLGLGEGFTRRLSRCVSCAAELAGRSSCAECGAFTCVRCDVMTSANGGDGMCCYRCQVVPQR